jgi:REP element-mobilizing transposase RayT
MVSDLSLDKPFVKGKNLPIRNCWHFCTDGNAVDRLFDDDHDFRDGMNRVFIVRRDFSVIILAFCLMDTHVHFILYGAFEECNKFMHKFIQLTSRHIWFRHAERKKLWRLPISHQFIDNDFYLKHTWQKQRNSVGSIFLEHLNRPDLTDFNTIVYGHNMRDKSMFGQLDNYSIEGFWETHPYVYIAIDSGVYRYEVFAFLQAPVDSVTYSIRPQRDDTKQEFIDYSMEHTWIDTGVRPVITDRILTLSTCTGRDYSARNVVQARLPMMEVTE